MGCTHSQNLDDTVDPHSESPKEFQSDALEVLTPEMINENIAKQRSELLAKVLGRHNALQTDVFLAIRGLLTHFNIEDEINGEIWLFGLKPADRATFDRAYRQTHPEIHWSWLQSAVQSLGFKFVLCHRNGWCRPGVASPIPLVHISRHPTFVLPAIDGGRPSVDMYVGRVPEGENRPPIIVEHECLCPIAFNLSTKTITYYE